ncbi:hypothetical protein PCE1_000866 [Barthelona sp. PCE]
MSTCQILSVCRQLDVSLLTYNKDMTNLLVFKEGSYVLVHLEAFVYQTHYFLEFLDVYSECTFNQNHVTLVGLNSFAVFSLSGQRVFFSEKRYDECCVLSPCTYILRKSTTHFVFLEIEGETHQMKELTFSHDVYATMHHEITGNTILFGNDCAYLVRINPEKKFVILDSINITLNPKERMRFIRDELLVITEKSFIFYKIDDRSLSLSFEKALDFNVRIIDDVTVIPYLDPYLALQNEEDGTITLYKRCMENFLVYTKFTAGSIEDGYFVVLRIVPPSIIHPDSNK